MSKNIETVDELIKHLESLGRSRAITVYAGGGTFDLTEDDIVIWDPRDENSHVTIMAVGW